MHVNEAAKINSFLHSELFHFQSNVTFNFWQELYIYIYVCVCFAPTDNISQEIEHWRITCPI
jgi:hypothetical protein